MAQQNAPPAEVTHEGASDSTGRGGSTFLSLLALVFTCFSTTDRLQSTAPNRVAYICGKLVLIADV